MISSFKEALVRNVAAVSSVIESMAKAILEFESRNRFEDRPNDCGRGNSSSAFGKGVGSSSIC